MPPETRSCCGHHCMPRQPPLLVHTVLGHTLDVPCQSLTPAAAIAFPADLTGKLAPPSQIASHLTPTLYCLNLETSF